MKKILSLVLAALMVFSMVPAIFADDAVTAVAEETSEYQAAIDFLKLLGIYVGTSDTTFVSAAKEPVNRAQMALFTSRFITGQVDKAYWQTSENDSGFTDVEDLDEEALGAISFASQKGIVNGIGDGLFDPEEGVQYREAITMIVRSLGYTYKASGYPWSYINKAREIGLLDGITGIGYTQQINREVVAQLLFNALFVEMDGTNVAESTFGVGATVVMITASNKVVYGKESTVTRTNYVRFQELDAQGEPTGASYHVSYEKFDLANGALAADAAVGTIYAITYKDGCADVLAAESLTTVYENRGAETTYYKDNYLYIAGSKLRVVNSFNSLYNAQGWNADAAGNAEVKLYQTYGLTVTTGGNYAEYIIDSNKSVYKITATGYELYAMYSTIMGAYYTTDYKVLTEAQVADLFAKSTNALGGFKKVTSFASKVAYADFIASDANLDGVIDRVAMKQYTFGKITFGKKLNKYNTSSDKSTNPTFNVQAIDTTNAKTTQTMANVIAGVYGGDGNGNNVNGKPEVGNPFISDYRWTGETLTKDAYVLYYVDTINKEIDILKVVDADAADGTYTVKGYLRGYNAATDTIYLGTEYTAYTLGYDTLNGAPIKSKSVKDNQAVNVALVQPLINTYVELVIVDNKVVMINGANQADNFVIIDSFVGFEEDGIVVNAWTTVTDEYTQIKIAEFNGWNVGGYDYTLLYLSTWLGDSAFAKLPVKTNTLYKVVYSADGVYNLTNPTAYTADTTLAVNAYGYIEGVDKDGKLGVSNYTQVADGDYWLFLVLDADDATVGAQPKVIALSGKAQTGVSVTGNAYKTKEHDYVFVVNTLDDIAALDIIAGTTHKYVMYNAAINNIENQFMFNPNSAYSWCLLMQNVKTAGSEIVYIDPALVNGWNGLNLSNLGFAQGNIYRVVVDANGNNVLTATDTYELDVVADLYANKDGFSKVKTVKVPGGAIKSVYTAIATDYVETYYGDWTDAKTLEAYIGSFAKDSYITVRGIVSNALTTNKDSLVADANSVYTVEYIFDKNGKAFAWVVDSVAVKGTGAVVKSLISTTAPDMSTVTGEDAGLAAIKPTASWTFDPATGNYTYKLLFDEKVLKAADVEDIAYKAGFVTKHAADADDNGIWGESDSLTTNLKLTSITVTITRACGYDLYYVINF